MPLTSTCFPKVVCVAAGQVVAQRVRPALHELAEGGLGVSDVAYLDVLPHAPAWLWPPNGFAERYLPIGPDGALPAVHATADDPDTLALVCCPSALHARYALQLAARVGRVAAEKPLCLCHDDAQALLACDRVVSIGHQLFKAEMLAFLAHCGDGGLDLARVARMDFVLAETAGVAGRQIDDCIWDLGWHGFECMLAPLRAAGIDAAFDLDTVGVWTYRPEPGDAAPAVTTATRIGGTIRADSRKIPFTIRAGKGLARARKELLLRDHAGRVLHRIDLGESGHAAHARLLRELLTAERPDMRLSLADATTIVALCAEASEGASHEGRYAFGSTPSELRAG